MSVDCRTFFALLDGLPDAAPSDLETMRDHVRDCPGCRDLAGMLVEAETVEPPGDLVDSVLATTSGPTCAAARELLGDLADGRLDGLDAGLVRGHVDACESCAGIERTLTALARDLPALATLRTDDRFVEDVLRRTPPRDERWAARVGSGLRRLLERPRLALEGAYLGSLVLFAAVGLPQGLPRATLEDVAAAPVERLRQIDVGSRVASGTSRAWGWTRDRVADASADAAAEIAVWRARAADRLQSEWGTFLDRAASGRENGNDAGPARGKDRPEGDGR